MYLFEKEPYKELQGVSTLNKINCGSEVKGPASTLVGMPWWFPTTYLKIGVNPKHALIEPYTAFTCVFHSYIY